MDVLFTPPPPQKKKKKMCVCVRTEFIKTLAKNTKTNELKSKLHSTSTINFFFFFFFSVFNFSGFHFN